MDVRQALQAQFFDIAHEAVIGFDPYEHIVCWNAGAERTYGWTEDEVVGKTREEILPVLDNDAGSSREVRFGVLRRGETLSGEYTTRRKNGTSILVEYNARAHFNEERQLVGYLTVHRDVTSRRQAERAVRESEARLRALIDSTPLGIVLMDLHGDPIFYNPKCTELHGFSTEESGKSRWEHALHPDDRKRVVHSWYAAANAGAPWAEIYRFLHPDGKVTWVSGRASPVRVDGELIGFVGTLENITDEREARRQAELLAQMREETLGIVAHELRSPLTTISLGAHMLMSEAFPEDQREFQLRAILRSAESMKRLINDLLDVYKATYGQFTVQRSPTDMAALCHEVSDRLKPEARERGIALSCHIPPHLPLVSGDLDRLMQVLSNLVGNALKFTPRGGQVIIRAEAEEGQIEISVEDTGPGIPSDKLPHVFERFWQGDRATRSGAGLGLPIAKAIVVAHDGRIWAESTAGAGTSMRFTVPVHKDGNGSGFRRSSCEAG